MTTTLLPLAGNSGAIVIDPVAYLFDQFNRHHDFTMESSCLVLSKAGSFAYNTFTEDSDHDFMGLVVPRMRHIVGLGLPQFNPKNLTFKQFEGWEPEAGFFAGDMDLKVYSIGKAMRLLLNGNPSLTEMLFFDPSLYLCSSKAWQMMVDHREIFLSKRTYQSLAGYARGQFHKMTSGGKTNRMSVERKEWVDSIGYDPKDASHLIRLCFMGIELARDGMIYPRLDGYRRETVMAIKSGKWALDDVKAYAEQLWQAGEDELATTSLPEYPDIDFAEVLLMETQREAVR